jgi:hypothetical protein
VRLAASAGLDEGDSFTAVHQAIFRSGAPAGVGETAAFMSLDFSVRIT